MALYAMATKGIEPKYNGDPAYLMSFLASVSSQATIFDWGSILTFGAKEFFKDYGTITTADMKAKATTYTGAVITRDSQNSAMMALYLQNSIDQNLFSKLLNISTEYTVNGQRDGPMMLKTIISLVQVATEGSAMALSLQHSLSNLKVTVQKYDSIVEFNSHVREIIQTLENYGHHQSDSYLLSQLFEAYLAVEDSGFHSYIVHCEMLTQHGQPGAIKEPKELMKVAEETFKIRKFNNQWMVPSKEQAQLIALQAQLDKKKKTKETKSKTEETEDKDWKNIPPAKGEKHSKKVGNRTYHWCAKHKAWTVHHPKDCRLKQNTDSDKSKDNESEEKKEDEPPKETKVEAKKGKKKKAFVKAKLSELLAEYSDDSSSSSASE